MPRQPRRDAPGAIHHVWSRGIDGRAIDGRAQRAGYVFQARFGSRIVRDDEDLLRTLAYGPSAVCQALRPRS